MQTQEIKILRPSVKADTSSATTEWYTPKPIIDSVAKVLGAIDLDPASCSKANEFVGAAKYLTVEDDALSPETVWGSFESPSRVFLNPPSMNVPGKINGTRSLASAFFNRLCAEYLESHIHSAIYLVVSTKLLHANPEMLEYPICFVSGRSKSACVTSQGRIKFVSATGEIQKSPTQTNAFILLPSDAAQVKLFAEEFSQYGKIFNADYFS